MQGSARPAAAQAAGATTRTGESVKPPSLRGHGPGASRAARLRARIAEGRTRVLISFAVTSLCAAALFVFVARSVTATGQALRDAERAADARARAELLAMGWQPPASENLRLVADRLRASQQVEILAAVNRFRIELGDRTLMGDPADEEALAAASVLVADELGLFPPELLARSGLRRITLCTRLLDNGQPIPSLPNYRHTLLLDVGASADFMRRLLHHEVFHFIDFADDGEVLWDPRWEQLNPPEFVYGHGGRDMRDRGASALTDQRAGFLTRYATSALEEDKAETFAFMMATPSVVERRVRVDAIVAAKTARIRAIVGGLAPAADGAFWARIARHRAAHPADAAPHGP